MTASGIIHAINKQRKLKRLTQVSPNSTIDIAAKIQAKQMASTGQFGHVIKGAKYPTPDDRMRAAGLSHMKAGEVLYSCNPGMDDSDTAVQAWLGSKPHREAILHPDIAEIGVSIQHSSDGRPYACAIVGIPAANEDDVSNFVDKVLNAVKEYGKTSAKKLLIKAAQSSRMQNIIRSPAVQKLIAALR